MKVRKSSLRLRQAENTALTMRTTYNAQTRLFDKDKGKSGLRSYTGVLAGKANLLECFWQVPQMKNNDKK